MNGYRQATATTMLRHSISVTISGLGAGAGSGLGSGSIGTGTPAHDVIDVEAASDAGNAADEFVN